MTRQIQLLFFALSLFLVSACATLPPSKPPAPPVEAFSSSGKAALPDRWWRSFNDPALDALVERALEGNFSLQAVWERLRQAEASARKAGSDLFPRLDLQAGASHSRSDAGRVTTSEAFSLGLAASYELDLWGRVRSGRQAAEYKVRASAGDLRAAAVTLSSEIATVWYQLVEQNGQLALLDEQIAAYEQLLELVTLRFRAGKDSVADVLQQRQLLESRRGEKSRALAQAAVLLHQLNILLGISPTADVDVQTAKLPELSPLPETGTPLDLVRRRPDLLSAYDLLQAADRQTAVAVADRFPRLSLSARAETSASHARDLFDNWIANLAANLAAPILDGGARRAEVDRSRAAAAELLAGYRQAVLEAIGEVEDALVQEERQREYLASLQRQLELSERTIERVRDRYIQGVENYQRVLDALLSHQQLQRSRLTAQRGLIDDRISLCRALAGGWEMTKASPSRQE